VISVLVINYSKRNLLESCLASIEQALSRGRLDGEVLVIDNGSDDGSSEMVRDHYPYFELISLPHNEGFAPAVARGTRAARGDWLVLVNNDALVEPDCLRLMLEAGTSADDVGIVTAQVRFAHFPETINTAGLEVDKLGIAYDRLAGRPIADGAGSGPVEVFGASACVAAYRVRMLRELGGFDASFFAFIEDADVSWRARMSGWRCLYEPRAVAYHHGSATARDGSGLKYQLVGRNRVRLIAKNATTEQLIRWGWAMALYDLAYVAFVAVTERTLAPARGRAQGLREWRRFRRAGDGVRRPVGLAGVGGWRAALRMRRAYLGGRAGTHTGQNRDQEPHGRSCRSDEARRVKPTHPS
jgi:GT2 family glycosyltransferase